MTKHGRARHDRRGNSQHGARGAVANCARAGRGRSRSRCRRTCCYAAAEVDLLSPARHRERPAGDLDLIDRAAQLLGEAKQPIIFAGGGVLGSQAWDELLRAGRDCCKRRSS